MVSCVILLGFSWSSLLLLLVTQNNPFSERRKSYYSLSLLLCSLLLETQAVSKRWKFSEKYHSISWDTIKQLWMPQRVKLISNPQNSIVTTLGFSALVLFGTKLLLLLSDLNLGPSLASWAAGAALHTWVKPHSLK